MAENYAQALFELTQGASAEKLDAVMHRFVETLERKRHMRLLPSIVHHFERLRQRAERRATIELVVAKEADAEKYKSAVAAHSADLGDAHGKSVAVRVDDSVVGGYILQGNNIRIDASYRKHLLDLYSLLTS
jgi:F0F1-type ATP synthase delta subunit